MPQRAPASASNGWQAGPCIGDAPVKCAPDTPTLFYKTAGGHPPIAFLQFIVRHIVREQDQVEPLMEPILGRVPKTVRIDLPPGLAINPNASPEKCPLSVWFHQPKPEPCPPGSRIGQAKLTGVTTKPHSLGGSVEALTGRRVDTFHPSFEDDFVGDIFNIAPRNGDPALFGFVVLGHRFTLEPEVAFESDYHTSFTLNNLPNLSANLLPLGIRSVRLINFGNVGDGSFVTLPTTCINTDLEPQFKHLYSSWIQADSYERPGFAGTNPFESPLPAGVSLAGCENIPFDPSIEVVPGTAAVDSPAAPTVTTRLKVQTPGGGPLAESHLRSAEVTLPAGMGLNPAGLRGLVPCKEAGFNKGNRELFNECPQASIVGKAEIETPVLSETLQGSLYLGEPKSTDPASGDQFRLFLEAGSFERGVVVRLIGRIKADPRTGQLTAVFDERPVVGRFAGPLPAGLPQVPLRSLKLQFKGGGDLLTSPPACSRSATTAAMEPWARPGTQARPVSSFTLTAFPGGGPCPPTWEERPFAPSYSAKSDNAKAGSFSPFRVRIVRSPGHQELKLLDAVLPKGVIGKLAGIPYCPEQAIAAAAGKSGVTEQKAPSCPAASRVGGTSTESGSGADPLRLPGNVYLAGPHKGAPLSLVAITAAVSGPFDLGTVMVRVALHVDPTSAQVTARSDTIPDVFGGVKLSLRAIDFNLDRENFMLNPTNCSAQAVTGSLKGGGADPAEAALWSSSALSTPFQAAGCDGLGFAPKLTTKVSGPTKRNKYPRLRATLSTRPGDANLSGIALALPSSFRVAQKNISTTCGRAQLASRSCPASSVYGSAEVSTPLLDGTLSGLVHLVPGGGKLPDLVADLRGQVDIQLRGEVKPRRKGIEVVFDSLPDVPVRELTLAMAGGKKGLIVNSTNVCKGKRRAVLQMRAQNGKQLTNKKYKLKLAGCKKRKMKRKG